MTGPQPPGDVEHSALTIVKAGMWQRVQGYGLERFELARDGSAWILAGTIIAKTDTGAAAATYEVACDDAWRTRRADISIRDERGTRRLEISTINGRWLENNRERSDLADCIDIDLGWTPSTNTLPIRRLALPVGGSSGPVTAAWVRFPELRLERLPQEYVRLAENRYRYSSRGGSFTADIDVDEDGVVVDYAGIWTRVG